MSMLSTVLSRFKRKDDVASWGNRALRDNPSTLRALFADEFAMHDLSAVHSMCRHRAAKGDHANRD